MVAVLARGVFWILAVYIVWHAVAQSFGAGDPAMGVAKVLFFPLTYFIYPWTAGLVGVFIASMVAYWVSNMGALPPVD